MKKINSAASGGEQPATSDGGSTTPGASSKDQPIDTFGTKPGAAPSAPGADKDATVSFSCKFTLKNGATLFGGGVVGGKGIGSGENDDLVVEVEGSATVTGGENLFGGGIVGGRLIGMRDEAGGGGEQRQSYAPQGKNAARSGGRSEAD